MIVICETRSIIRLCEMYYPDPWEGKVISSGRQRQTTLPGQGWQLLTYLSFLVENVQPYPFQLKPSRTRTFYSILNFEVKKNQSIRQQLIIVTIWHSTEAEMRTLVHERYYFHFPDLFREREKETTSMYQVESQRLLSVVHFTRCHNVVPGATEWTLDLILSWN